MTWHTKIKIMITVTLLMAFGFIMMLRSGLYIPCIILGCIWLFHILYFVFRVKKYIPKAEHKPIPSKQQTKNAPLNRIGIEVRFRFNLIQRFIFRDGF